MPRTARLNFSNTIYHLMNRGNNRQRIFFNDKDYERYIALLKKYSEQFGLIVYAYCLMSTHLHLLIETMRANLPVFMKSLNMDYAWWYKKTRKLVGHLFQGRYKSIIVDRDKYLLGVSRYIHLQGVRAGLVKKPDEYPWSSYLGYIQGNESWIDVEPVLGQFGIGERARERYKEFVEDGIREDIEGPPIYKGIIYGDKNFGERILKLAERRKNLIDGRLRRRLDREKYKEIHFDHILGAVAKFYHQSQDELLKSKTREVTKNRHALIYLLRRHTNLSLGEIGERVGPYGHTSVSSAIKRIEKKMQTDKLLEEEITGLEELILKK